ncbi:butyrophilin subfamily 2 member A1-like [Falco peregrinus]|uniref:butyrophilin subfamily 2 member A1-like n=1 Tax=Falco peregrinus TaxID=8954 RepID=UPI002479BE59|nr:butyrophilin subfamily 2 member A1-like [Falco peregrinus]
MVNCCLGMGLSGQVTAVIFTFVLVSPHHPTAGVGHDPLLVLDGYEDSGIRMKCFSERLFAQVQLLWTDGRGDNITGTPLTSGTTTGNAGSSIILKPGSGNSMSCKIIDKLLKTSTESSVVIADVFFPATSPWLTAFVMLLLLSIFLVIAAIYKLRKNEKTITRESKSDTVHTRCVNAIGHRERHEKYFEELLSGCKNISFSTENAQMEIKKEIEELKEKLAEEQQRCQKESQDMSATIEKLQNEMEFRRAQSKAVTITLDETCLHPNTTSKMYHQPTLSSHHEIPPDTVVVATEGFSEKKHYWEVEVGDKPEWELGVVREDVRWKLRNKAKSTFLEGSLFSLQFSQGEYSLTGGKVVGSRIPCRVVGVLLDQQSDILYFFHVEEKCHLAFVPLNSSGKFYPFFSSGSNGK